MMTASMLPRALLCWLWVPLAAQDAPTQRDPVAAIEVIAATTTTPEQRGEAFATARSAEFPRLAQKLVRTMESCRRRRGESWIESGIGPRTDRPWLEQDLGLEDRIGFTLQKLWVAHTMNGFGRRDAPLLVEILEDRECGAMRYLAVSPLQNQLGDFLREDPTLVRSLVPRLDALARSQDSPTLRAGIVSVLAAHTAPDPLLDLAWAIAATEPSLVQRGELLRRTQILASMQRLSPTNRKLCLQQAFSLLRRMDDGKGVGYFLAMDIGRGIGIEPVAPAASPFTPDPRSPAYAGGGGLVPKYFQDTVANALAWWGAHKDD